MATLEELYNGGAKFLIKIFKRPYGDKQPHVDGGVLEENFADKHRKELSFNLEPLQVFGNVLAAKSIHVDGNLITFENTHEKVQVDLWALRDSRPPLVYQDVVVDRGLNYNDDIPNYLIVRPISECASMNKRNAFRVRVGIGCQVQMHAHGGVVPATLLDVSVSGFAIEIKADVVSDAVPKQDTLSVEFTDASISGTKLSVTGLCVRKVENEKSTIYGCMCTTPTKDYKNYVMQKQAKKAHA